MERGEGRGKAMKEREKERERVEGGGKERNDTKWC